LDPLEFFRRIRNAQLLGFSTSSSSATLPVTIQIAEENLGVSKKIASFVLPLGATVNMDGTALYQGVAVMFIAQVFGIELSLFAQLTVVLTATLASIGAAGVPSAGIITLTIVLVQAGVPETGIALILGVDRILDMLRTSVNITGDLTGTVLIAQTEGESLDLSQRLETKESVGAA
ncbi:MAG: dicarboxylate/amino acid:cation symporter, partial [Gemmatimonadetes bacterium]|nr:dicarboxylate/amino acid:cation symporter [Gemmatimonadota bacterium]